MPRRNRDYTSLDVIRIFEKNLTLGHKRVVLSWFFSLIPIKEPRVDALQIILDFLSILPVVGRFADLFQISVATAQAAKDIAELFQFEFEEEEVELAQLRLELQTLREEFKNTREELLRCQIDYDNERERSSALLGTIELLEDEIRQLSAPEPPPPPEFLAQVELISSWIDIAQDNASRLPPHRHKGTTLLALGRIETEYDKLRSMINA